jgi:hypothetical protein
MVKDCPKCKRHAFERRHAQWMCLYNDCFYTEPIPNMTDAGLSGTALIEALRDPDLLDGARQHYLDALAERLKEFESKYVHQDLLLDAEERLKACEQARESDFMVFHELRMRLSEASGEPFKLAHEALESIIQQRDQLTADLAHARAEVSSLVDNLSACKYDEVAKQNQRLRAALEALIKMHNDRDPPTYHNLWEKAQAALTVSDHIPADGSMETPAQRGGYATEQQQ